MKKNSTIFAQMLQLIPRYRFEKAVKEHKTEHAGKGFSSWAHFSAMLFAQLSGQRGLRGIESGLAAQRQAAYHLGLRRPVKRSTLAYANEHRSAGLFESLFGAVLEQLLARRPEHGFRFKNPLYSVDATTIDLCLKLFPWADFRTAKAGIKLTVKLDHRGHIPRFVVLHTAAQHESTAFRSIPFEKADVLTFDRGFTDYKLFASLDADGIYFVTRQKSNADYRVVERRAHRRSTGILSDQIIEWTGFYSKKNCPLRLRRIVTLDKKTGKRITLLTNHFEWSAQTIATVYRDRWQIELFFKTIKQFLKIKRFFGTSRNAVLIQIWTAMIAYLLISYLKFLAKSAWRFAHLVAGLPMILFQKRDIWEWLCWTESPPRSPPNACAPQLELI